MLSSQNTWEKISTKVGHLSWYKDQGKKPLGSQFPKNISLNIILEKSVFSQCFFHR